MMNNFLNMAIAAAIDAGAEIMKIYNDPTSDFEVEIKSDNSPLTIADKISNDVITSYLRESNIPILSEEMKQAPFSERKDWDTLWVVDPIDGTKEFIKKNGEFTVNIALVKNHTPILGVVYLPAKGLLYFADEKIGAYRIRTSSSDMVNIMANSIKLPIERSEKIYRVVASRSHCNEETTRFINELKEIHGNVELVSSGSSIKICLVAEGSADIYPRFGPTMEWDTAAGHAIALYAGFQVVEAYSNIPLAYNKENLLNPYFIVK
ncbi:MAG: 3'(2'),5'-bisphosphate nucleotidase CysQ [Bacteroidales bacterium]